MRRTRPGVKSHPQRRQGNDHRLLARLSANDGPDGMANWLRQFRWRYYEALPVAQRQPALQETVESLRSVLLRDGNWFADYRRLRITAVKVKGRAEALGFASAL